MNFVSLEKLPFSVIHQAFLYAFSDYAVKMEMSEQELMNRLTRIAYKPKLSGGVLVDQTLCAFILTGLGQFQGKLTAYNGGTGVIPTHRRQQLGTKVYQALLELYRAQDVEQCLLEVITDNDKAVKLYKSLGFRVSRVFKCYALNEKLEKETVDVPLQISQAESIDLTKYVPFCTTQPSWQNMMEAVLRDLNQEIILEAYSKTTLVGFISFNPVNGKLSQLAVAPDYRRAKIGSSLIRTAQRMTQKNVAILNVEEADRGSCRFFEALGFGNPLDQYEMLLDL